MNDKVQAEKNISYVLNQFPENQIDFADLAYVNSALGNIEKAFELLEKAFSTGSAALCALRIEKRCRNLRNDPRFDLLLERMGLS